MSTIICHFSVLFLSFHFIDMVKSGHNSVFVSNQWISNHKVSHVCPPESFNNCSLYTNPSLIIHDVSPQAFCPILNLTDCEYSHLCAFVNNTLCGCWPLWDHESELSDAQTGMSLQVYFTFSLYTFLFIKKISCRQLNKQKFTIHVLFIIFMLTK